MRMLRLTAKFCLVFAAVLFVHGFGTRRPPVPASAAPNADGFDAARVTPRVVPGKIVAVCVVDP